MAKKPEPRKALHAYLDDDAHERWHDYAAVHGVSVSGLLQSIASTGVLDKWGDNSAVVKEARKVDTDRRRRNRRR